MKRSRLWSRLTIACFFLVALCFGGITEASASSIVQEYDTEKQLLENLTDVNDGYSGFSAVETDSTLQTSGEQSTHDDAFFGDYQGMSKGAAAEDPDMQEGWVEQDKKKYYYVNGTPIKGLQVIDEKTYGFSTKDGELLLGLHAIDGKHYFFDLNSGVMQKGNVYLNDVWYRFDPSSGEQVFGNQYIDGNWYRYDPYDGHLLLGNQYIDGSWYRYDPYDGHLIFGSQYIDGNWYWYDIYDGHLHRGLSYIAGNWYCYDLNDGRMLFGWQDISGQYHYFRPGDGVQEFASNTMYYGWRVAQTLSSPTDYLLLVDTDACATMVFYGSYGNWEPLYNMPCSPGAWGTPTIKGIYHVGSRGYSFGTSSYECFYWTQISGNYLFHSILYTPGGRGVVDGRLGMHLSHGCVRLHIDNAYWINRNIPSGTTIFIW